MPKLIKENSDNPIIGDYRGKPIRKYNLVVFRVNQYTYKQFIDLKIDFSLSPKDAILQKKIILK